MDHADRSIDRFLDDVASENVTPAGGTATALVGAIGASLCEMVCIHTIAGADAPAGLAEVRDDLRSVRGHLQDLGDRDSAVVEELFGTDRDDGDRDATLTKRATGVPLAIAEACLRVLDHATVVTERGDRHVVPDAVTGAFLADAALRAAVFTVRCNLEGIADPSFVDELDRRATELRRSAQRASARVAYNARDCLRSGSGDR